MDKKEKTVCKKPELQIKKSERKLDSFE